MVKKNIIRENFIKMWEREIYNLLDFFYKYDPIKVSIIQQIPSNFRNQIIGLIIEKELSDFISLRMVEIRLTKIQDPENTNEQNDQTDNKNNYKSCVIKVPNSNISQQNQIQEKSSLLSISEHTIKSQNPGNHLMFGKRETRKPSINIIQLPLTQIPKSIKGSQNNTLFPSTNSGASIVTIANT